MIKFLHNGTNTKDNSFKKKMPLLALLVLFFGIGTNNLFSDTKAKQVIETSEQAVNPACNLSVYAGDDITVCEMSTTTLRATVYGANNCPQVISSYKISDADTNDKSCFPTWGTGVIFQRAEGCEGYHHIWSAGSDLKLEEYDDNTAKITGSVIDQNNVIGIVDVLLTDKANSGTTWSAACYLDGVSQDPRTFYRSFNGTITVNGEALTVELKNSEHHYILADGAGFESGQFGLGAWTAGTFGGCTEWFGELDPITIDNSENNISYLWSTGETTSSITVTEPGEYTVTVKDCMGCTSTDTIKIIEQGMVNIGDYAWLDVNANGIQDDGNSGVNNLSVSLYSCDEKFVQTTTTSNDAMGKAGYYNFEVCANSGEYYVVFGNVPNELEFTISNGSSPLVNSDADNNGKTSCFEVFEQDILTIDAGLKENCTITVDAGDDITVCDMDTVTLTATANEANECLGGCEYPILQNIVKCNNNPNTENTYHLNLNSTLLYVEQGAKFKTFDDGTASINAKYTTLDGSETVDLNVTLFGGTNNINEAPHGNYCGITDYSNWYYYTGISGTAVSKNHGTYTIDRKGEPFQLGIGGDSTRPVFGMGGWFYLNGGDGTYTHGDFATPLGECSTVTGSNEITYLWSTGETTSSITVTEPGEYTVTVKDCKDCTATDTIKIIKEDKVAIGDYAWLDKNGNGIQDDGNTGVNNLSVTLYSCDGDQIETTTTANDATGNPGYYEFEVCPNSGEYYVVFGDVPNGLEFTDALTGDTALDSNTDENGKTACFEVLEEDITTIDAGLKVICTISVDAGEDITVCDMGTITLTATVSGANTCQDGGTTYLWSTGETTASITVTEPGEYTVTAKDCMDCSVTDTVNIIEEDKVAIGDYAWEDKNGNGIQDDGNTGVNNLSVTLYSCDGDQIETTTTANDATGNPGYYEFEVCPNSGEYYVVFGDIPNGLVFTDALTGDTALDSNADENGKTACFEVMEEDITTIDAGLKVDCNISVDAGDDVTVCDMDSVTLTATVSGANDCQNGGTTYLWSTGETTASITVTEPGEYTVTAKDCMDCSVTDTVNIIEEDKVAIGDYAWEDKNGNGIQDDGNTGVNNLSVTLYSCDGDQIETTTTANDATGNPGYYEFEVCPNSGEYYVVFGDVPNGLVFTDALTGDTALDSNADENGKTACFEVLEEDITTIDAGLKVDCNISVDAGDDVTVCDMDSVTLTATVSGANTCQDGGTTYLWSTGETTASITVTEPGEYTVTVNDCMDCSVTDTVNIIEEDKVAIGDYAWEDKNGNGIQDDGNTGVNNLSVTLYSCNGDQVETTTTANDATGNPGYYEFEVCPNSGEYYVVFGDVPNGLVFTDALTGDTALDSNADENGKTACFEVLEEDITTIDAGLKVDCNISVDAGDDVTVCDMDSVTLTATVSGANDCQNGGTTYLWSTGETTSSITVTEPGEYTVTVNDCMDCSVTDTVNIIEEDKVAIGDYAWEDKNGNGIQDDGNTGVNNLSVTLYSCNGDQVETTTTANDATGNPGYYEFEVCPNSGEYYVVFGNVPNGLVFTDALTGDTALDSNADENGKTACFEVLEEDITTIDAGLKVDCNISVDAGDDVTVCDMDSVTLTATVSGANDCQNGGTTYLWSTGETTSSITVTEPGEYTVTVNDCMDCSVTDTVNIIEEDKVAIGDYAWEDKNGNGIQDDGNTGVNNLSVTLYSCNGDQVETTTTANDATGNPGYYEFEVCPNSGEYYVVFGDIPNGLVFTDALTGDTALDSNADENGKTACFEVMEEDITTIDAGLKVDCNISVDAGDDVTVCDMDSVTLTATVSGANTCQNGGTTYLWSTGETTASITVTEPGEYTVTVNDCMDCTATDTVNIIEEDKVVIGDYAWLDENGNGIQDDGNTGVNNLSVTLYSCDGDQVETTTTANDATGNPGYYEFEVCPNSGEYYVVFGDIPNGLVFTDALTGDTALDSNADENGKTACFEVMEEDITTIDAGLKVDCNISVDAGDDVTVCDMDSVTLTATVSRANTCQNGGTTYLWSTGETTASITVTEPGEYTVTVNDCMDCTATDTVNIIEEDKVVIGDYAWLDENGNGIQDDGNTGVNNLSVTLYSCDGDHIETTTTANDATGNAGYYEFEVCPNSGEYYIVFGDVPNGLEFTDALIGDTALDSNADENGKTACFKVMEEDMTTIDAGLKEICNIKVDAGDDLELCFYYDTTVELTATIEDATSECEGGCVYPVLDQERCYSYNTTNSEIWIVSKEVSSDKNFKASEQRFEKLANGDAKYTATASNGIDNITVDVTFSGHTMMPTMGSPKLNLCQEYDTSEWEYWTVITGTISSQLHGDYTLTMHGEPFQMGVGADITRTGFGASGWFNVEGGDGYYTTGDFNLALSECQENGMEYKWSTENGSIIGDPNKKTITIDQPGTYVFEALNCVDCFASDQVVVVNSGCGVFSKTPVNNNPKITTMYPMPVSSGSNLTIEINNNSTKYNSAPEETVVLYVYDMFGKMVSNPKTYTLVYGKATIYLNSGNLPTGQYIVFAKGKTWTDSKSIIIK